MGKQKGDGARSKNRPSSSNLSASLLQSGTTSVGFGGYVGSSRVDTTLTKESNALLDVDGEVAQHLRRLSKKDPVTKVKALTSLSNLFRQCSASDLCHIVPQWVFEYKRLVQDNNRQVRQTAHDAMANLAITIGRSLAPHLRSLMGAWWLGQFDPYSEVAEAARRSFQAAFPVQEKRLEALAFCENEIFLYLDENLKLTPQTISDKTAPTEELEEMHQRVVSSSMLALASLLDVLLGLPLQKSTSENGSPIGLDSKNGAKVRSVAISATDKICHTHNFFQEFLKSRNSRVRSAVYQVFASFLKYIPQVVSEGNMKILAGIVLGSFQEKDPNCHSSMWDMLLLFMRRFPEAWKIAPVHKVILPRFWCFLRHGCYGSQQTSYPCLLPMIVSIPPTIISAEFFFIEFFQNLWAGRSTVSTSPADRASLFAAIKECLLWLLNNASRFVEGSGCIEQFCVKLVECIIFRLLWCDYITLGKSNTDSNTAKDTDDNLATKKLHNPKQDVQNNLNFKHLEDFKQDLGNSIIDILSNISIKYPSLLHVFCIQFQIECLKMIEQVGSSALPEGDQHMNSLSDFFRLLGTHSMNKGEKWPLVHLARPFAGKSFPVIKSMALPPSIKLLSVIISVFGTSVLPVESFVDEEGEFHLQMSTSYDHEPKPEMLLQFFKAEIATWCLHGNNFSTISRIDLLLSFLEDAYFQNEWDWVVGCAAGMENGLVLMDDRYLNNDHIAVLATLMEKVRNKFIYRSVSNKSSWKPEFEDKNWHSTRLDTVAIRIASDKTLKNPSHVLLLRYILGGTEPEDTVSLVSIEALNLIMEEILRQLVGVLIRSPSSWAKHAALLFLCDGMEGQLKTDILLSTSEEALHVASFAIQVLGGSFFSLKILNGNFQVVPHILAASICLDWETKMSKKFGQKSNYLTPWELDEDARFYDEGDTGSYSEGESIDELVTEQADEGTVLDVAHELEVAFVKSMQDLLSKIAFFSKSFSSASCERLRSLLIESIRCCIFEENTCEVESVVTLCAKWMVEIMGYTCKDENEEQQLLDHLLLSHEAWPFWAKTSVVGELKPVVLKAGIAFSDTERALHTRFVMFVERIGSIVGIDKLFIGSLTKTSQITVEHMSNQICNKKPCCRIWLALEVLCTWRWPGGSATEFLLPFFCECAKRGPGYPEWMMVNSIIDILFLGALRNNISSVFYPPNVWVTCDDEVDKIEEPFLRALIMLLIVLFKDCSISNSGYASRILQDHILKEEFLSTYINTYVKLLPHILNVLAPVLWKRTVDLEDCNEVLPMSGKNESNIEKAVCQWLERANSGPPLILCQKGQSDVEDWVNVAVSCFPLHRVGGVCAITTASLADISNDKRKLLLGLFQKQAQKAISEYRARAAEHRASLETSSDAVTYWEPTTELCLSKLMAVAIVYCWQEFRDDDWAFVLAQLRKWLDVAVSSMEDLAEGVNDVVKKTDPHTSLEIDGTLKSIENVVKSSKISSVELTEMAVFIFSLLRGLHNFDGEGLNSSKLVNWGKAEARAFENILRLFFATGIAESIASSSCAGKKAGAIVALSRKCNSHFWECVASVVVDAPSRAKEAAVHATELWGLSKGAISALYEILFSVDPIPALQLAAYNFLSSDSIQPLSVTKGVLSARLGKSIMENEEAGQTTHMKSSSDESSAIREELSCVLETSSTDLLGSNFTAFIRVQYLLAWSLFLTRLQAVPSLSAARECMVQYAQDSGSTSTLLDCLFQHIPIKQSSPSSSKKYNTVAIEANGPASAAKRSVATSSLYFAVEALWPIDIDKMAALAGAVYGLMLRVLPAYVRDWIINLRDRPAASFIEAFTTIWCSHQLLDDEFSKIQAAGITDESLSIRANRSAREVTAIYTKEEAVMDVVIRLPSCYPLRPVDMECTRKIGVNETNLRKWMLSMTSFVRNQNGAVSEAIQIWKRHINREFEGVEECPICYSIVHSANHSLPRLACKTCKHKYHAACLYKWFSTSLKSTCPLCQSPF